MSQSHFIRLTCLMSIPSTMLQCVVNGWCMKTELLRTVCKTKKVRISLLVSAISLISTEYFHCLAIPYILVREHYTGNKIRNAQVREDLPRAKVEQELEELRYQSYIQQQLVFNSLIALVCAKVYTSLQYFRFQRGKRCPCCETDRIISGTRRKAERTRVARADEAAIEIGRRSCTA